MYETLHNHVVHDCAVSCTCAIWGLPYTQTHSYSNISECGSALYLRMAYIARLFPFSPQQCIRQTPKIAAERAYKTRSVAIALNCLNSRISLAEKRSEIVFFFCQRNTDSRSNYTAYAHLSYFASCKIREGVSGVMGWWSKEGSTVSPMFQARESSLVAGRAATRGGFRTGDEVSSCSVLYRRKAAPCLEPPTDYRTEPAHNELLVKLRHFVWASFFCTFQSKHSTDATC